MTRCHFRLPQKVGRLSTALIDGDVLLHWSAWNTNSIDDCISNYNKTLASWVEVPFCSDFIVCVGPRDGKNFRDDIYPEYKQTTMRVTGRDRHPDHFYQFKNWIYEQTDTIIADNIEADDLLGIYSHQINSVIVSVDKDLNQLEGFHYNPRKKEERVYYQTAEEANLFLLEQLVKGDPMDKIPGIPGWGNHKASQFIRERSHDPAEAARGVLDLYRKTYNEGWLNYFLFNGKLLYLMRRDYDWFTMDKFEAMFFDDQKELALDAT